MKITGLFARNLMVMVMCMVAIACSKEEYKSRLKELIIEDIEFSAASGSNTQTFRSEDLSNYKAQSDQEWCVATIGQGGLTVTVTANDTYEVRKATVTLTDNKDGAATRSFTVSQTQKDAIIIGQDTYEVGGDGGKVTINVQHNIDYIMDLSDVNWIVETSTGKTRALETTNIVLEVKKNDSGGPREATVKIINKVSGETSKVTIKQGFNADFSVNAESLSIDERGGMLQILVKANFSVDISFGDTWLSDGGREKVDDLYFWQKVKVDPLTDENNASRTSTVTLSNLTNGQIKVVTVVQTFNPEFSVNTESLSIDERGGTLQVLVKANFTVVTGFGDTWLSDGGREKVDDVLFWQKVNVDSFTEKTTSRTSTMTLANLAYGQYKNVAIVQTHPLFIQAVTVTLKVGDTYPLPLYNESNTAVVWKSANENVATVDMDGKVTGKAVGKTTIKMTSSDGLHKDEVTVTVEQKEEEVPPVESE